jgi:hypothetical protein
MAEDQKSKTPPSPDEIKEHLRRLRKGIRITKITTTRSVKGRNGDSFVGFSAAWQSVQDDHSGPGADVMASSEDDAVSKLTRYMLALETDLAALESALANGSISPNYFKDAVRGIRSNYDMLVLREMGVDPDEGKPST